MHVILLLSELGTSDLTRSATAAIVSRVCVIASEMIALVATWVKTYWYIRAVSRLDVPTNLSTVLLRDGTRISYFLALLLKSIAASLRPPYPCKSSPITLMWF